MDSEGSDSSSAVTDFGGRAPGGGGGTLTTGGTGVSGRGTCRGTPRLSPTRSY